MRTVSLNGLGDVSRLSLGGGIGQIWGETSRDEALATLHAAVDAGISLIDCAPLTVGMLSDTTFHGPKGLMTSIVVVSTGVSLIGLLFMMFGASSRPSTFQAAAAADREGVPT